MIPRPGALVALATAVLAACGPSALQRLETRMRGRVAASGVETVGVYFRDLDRSDSVLISADLRVHAASMMKVPVLIQLFRDQDAGRLRLTDSVVITNTFHSIVDGSAYELNVGDDSDSTLYRRLGERESLRRLAELMITVSSNLATNILIEVVGADRAQATMRALGADSIAVLRGVEDGKAYRAGLNNTTTARDLGVIFAAIAEGRAASDSGTREMVDMLSRQQFNEGIPSALPPGTRVAHKTGWITGIRHDGGIVFTPAGRYVLVVLVRGLEDTATADAVIRDIAALAQEYVINGERRTEIGDR